ncbi:hypothetical protein V22_12380 [Calycomorphotria hydatis]|uniref:PnuC protein n=2 Tax=Calycomorphotria hydatis TaxID=2528027 RepID=A0A517T6L6_9PLAN|nr:hypothetical protein V22_12380 [Calycomorphotria hydatis]
MDDLQLLEFYGFDWAAMFLCFAAMWLIGNRNPWGFVVFMLGNTAWTVFGLFTGSIPVIVGNLGFVLINARGLHEWRKEQRRAVASEI